MTTSWTAPEIDRAPSPRLCSEREALQGWLDFHRQTLLSKCSGLNHEQLATRSVPPSRLSLLGLVRHMAEVEAWWFRTCLRGQHAHGFYGPEDNLDGDFEDLDSVPAEDVFARYAEECRLADAAADGLALETTFLSPGRQPGSELDLRWLYLHMIEEYARHNGHADLLRELIDGTTGD
jgi:hypothetical protein